MRSTNGTLLGSSRTISAMGVTSLHLPNPPVARHSALVWFPFRHQLAACPQAIIRQTPSLSTTSVSSPHVSSDQLPAIPAVQLQSLDTLRASLAGSGRNRTTAWIKLGGLAIEEASAHGAFCNTLERLGLTTDATASPPQLVVLDWSTVDECTSEGVSFFATLARQLVESGVRVIVTEPASAGIRGVLADSGLRARCDGLEWVPCEACGHITVRSIARAAFFSRVQNESVDDFCDDLSAALEDLRVPRKTLVAIAGTTFEMLHNVLSHADAPHGAATALIFPRRRPKVLQVGIADNGLGIPGSVLRHPRHAWLAWFSDAEVTSAVLRGNLSGRGAESGLDEGGGGLARAVRRLLSETSARLVLRTARALVILQSGQPDRFMLHRLTYGTGTQIRLQIALC